MRAQPGIWNDDERTFEPLLPDQWFASIGESTCDVPEKRLLLAVLLDAVICLRQRDVSAAVEAVAWIRGEHGDADRISFVDVCESLGLEPTYLASGILSGFASGARAGGRADVRARRDSPAIHIATASRAAEASKTCRALGPASSGPIPIHPRSHHPFALPR